MSFGERTVLGTWGLGGSFVVEGRPVGYGHVTAAAFDAVLDAAAGAGVTWTDTALTYGGGQAVERLAAWQARRARRLQVAMKVGRVYRDGRPVSAVDYLDLRSAAADAAARLGSPAALLVKDPPRELIAKGRLFVLLDCLQDDFPGCTLGFATHCLDIGGELPAVERGTRILQMEFNAVRAVECTTLARAAHEKGWTVWGMQPLAFGFLAGRHSDAQAAADDFRSLLPRVVRQTLAAMARSFDAHTSAIAERHSLAERALAFCYLNRNVDRVVIGPKTVEQLESARRAAALAEFDAFQNAINRMLENAYELR